MPLSDIRTLTLDGHVLPNVELLQAPGFGTTGMGQPGDILMVRCSLRDWRTQNLLASYQQSQPVSVALALPTGWTPATTAWAQAAPGSLLPYLILPATLGIAVLGQGLADAALTTSASGMLLLTLTLTAPLFYGAPLVPAQFY